MLWGINRSPEQYWTWNIAWFEFTKAICYQFWHFHVCCQTFSCLLCHWFILEIQSKGSLWLKFWVRAQGTKDTSLPLPSRSQTISSNTGWMLSSSSLLLPRSSQNKTWPCLLLTQPPAFVIFEFRKQKWLSEHSPHEWTHTGHKADHHGVHTSSWRDHFYRKNFLYRLKTPQYSFSHLRLSCSNLAWWKLPLPWAWDWCNYPLIISLSLVLLMHKTCLRVRVRIPGSSRDAGDVMGRIQLPAPFPAGMCAPPWNIHCLFLHW